MSKHITVDGKKHKVIEDLGYVSGRDQYAKVVITSEGEERVVVRDVGSRQWRLSKPAVVFSPATKRSLYD